MSEEQQKIAMDYKFHAYTQRGALRVHMGRQGQAAADFHDANEIHDETILGVKYNRGGTLYFCSRIANNVL